MKCADAAEREIVEKRAAVAAPAQPELLGAQ